ncbi:MAG: glycyl-radical enzyme activating protein [Clostridia bacterium]|nr:glycyl-radical enzyme activating protein [Clostridia bacterium]
MQDIYSVKGRIFDIQRFSIHDGAGIRTIVFLKGCPLRCRWCCNPEGQEYRFEELTLAGKTKTVGEDLTVEEVMRTVRRDRPYYDRSGGGLTLSGGECLAQPDFAYALLAAAHGEGIHTAIETTLNVPRDVVARVLPVIDTVLMDLKHADSAKHKEYTGVSNELILDNARYAAAHARELIVRVPVIPTFNDMPEEIRAIARLAATLPRVERLHLLPYHRLGQDKYAGLNRPYLMDGIETIPDARMRYLLEIAETSGLRCQIGG